MVLCGWSRRWIAPPQPKWRNAVVSPNMCSVIAAASELVQAIYWEIGVMPPLSRLMVELTRILNCDLSGLNADVVVTR